MKSHRVMAFWADSYKSYKIHMCQMLYEHQMGCLGINILLNLASAVIHEILVPDENLDIASGIISMCVCSEQLWLLDWIYEIPPYMVFAGCFSCLGLHGSMVPPVKSHSLWVK